MYTLIDLLDKRWNQTLYANFFLLIIFPLCISKNWFNPKVLWNKILFGATNFMNKSFLDNDIFNENFWVRLLFYAF